MPSNSQVVTRIKESLESSGKTCFSLKEVDNIYRRSVGEPIPYRDCDTASLQELLEKQCDFLTVMKADIGTEVQVLLNPPRYQETVSGAQNESRHNEMAEEVHNELALNFIRQLKTFINSVGQGGLSFDEFEQAYNKSSSTPFDYKGFSRETFYRGLSDVFAVRNENGTLKLYPASDATARRTPQQSTNTAEGPSRPVGPQLTDSFERILESRIQQCAAKYKGGVTVDEFREHFKATNSKPLHMMGLSDEEFFGGLPHIFRVEKHGKIIKLFPAAEAPSKEKVKVKSENDSANTCKHKTDSKRETHTAPKNKQGRGVPSKSAPTSAAAKQVAPAEMKTLSGARELWIVTCDSTRFVPTGCISKLAGRSNDTVVEDLHKMFLRPSFYKMLEDEATKAILIRNGVADSAVKMLPLKSCAAIVRVLMGSRTDETLIRDIVACY